MRHKDFDIQVIIDSLGGTCRTIQETIDICYPGMDESEMKYTELLMIDNQIFLCDSCGFWCMGVPDFDSGPDENICEDCYS